MYIILNQDGSVKESQLSDYINQYSDGVNFIDIAVVGKTPSAYTASVLYTFSNEETETDSADGTITIETSDGTYEGWRFILWDAMTQYDGDLLASFVGTNSDGTQLFSYPVTMTVNKTSSVKRTNITWEEYKSLKASQADYQLQYSSTNVRGYGESLETYKTDLSKLPDETLSLVYNDITDSVEVCQVTTVDGEKVYNELSVGYIGNLSNYVWKSYSTTSIQEVHSGLNSTYESSDGNWITYYGTTWDADNQISSFSANVKNGSGNYAGEINLGAKEIKLETVDPVDSTHVYAFSADQNATKLADPAGTTTLKLGIGEASLYGNTVKIATGEGYDNLIKINNDAVSIYGAAGVSICAASQGTIDLKGYVKTYSMVDMAYCPNCEKAPTKDTYLTNKKYVDGEIAGAKNHAQNLMDDLRDYLEPQIDAINASQNFVATYASKADMPTPPVSGLEEKDCVLVLKDESKQDQAYVYKYASTGWVEVGPLGDYYTKAEIKDMHAGIETAYKAYSDASKTEAETYASNAVKAVFTATSSSTEVSE